MRVRVPSPALLVSPGVRLRELVFVLREVLQDTYWSDKELVDALWEAYAQWNRTPPKTRTLQELLRFQSHWKLPLLWGALCVLLPGIEDPYLESLYKSAWQRYGAALEYKLRVHEALNSRKRKT